MAGLITPSFAGPRRSAFMGAPACAPGVSASPMAPRLARGANSIEMAQKLLGTVVSTKMDKTAVVAVVREVPHPRYIKRVRKTKKYFAHDEEEVCNVGDYVEIQPTRPLSKLKRFKVAEIVRKSVQ